MSVQKDDYQASWDRKSLSDIADVIRGVTYKKAQASTESEPGKLPVLRATNIQDGELVLNDDLVYVPRNLVSNNQLLKVGDIVVATSSGSKHLVGKTAQLRADWEGSFGAFCAAIRPGKKIEPRYLGYFFESREYKDYISKQALGVNINNLRRGDLEQISVPIAPTDQQKLIVAEIEKQFSRLDEAVTNLKRVKANLKRYKAAVLKAAVEGKLTEEWRKQNPDVEPADKLLERILTERRQKWEAAELAKMKAKGKTPKDDKWKQKYKEPTPLDVADLPDLPGGWKWATLDQIGQEGRPIIYGIIKPGPHDPEGVPYVRVTEMKDGFIDVPNLKRASPERAAKFARATLQSGDLLISKDGTIGRVAVVPPELEGANITQHVMRAPINLLLNRDYFKWAIRSDHCQRWLTGETKGVALRGVNVEDFRRLPIPIPPLPEQEQILNEVEGRFSLTLALERQIDNGLKRAERLRQSVLSKVFSGDMSYGQVDISSVSADLENQPEIV